MKQYVYDVVFSIKKRITLEVPARNEEEANEKLFEELGNYDEDKVYFEGELESFVPQIDSVSEYKQ